MLFSFVLAIQAFSSLVAAYAGPGACSGDCGTHDPSIIRRASDGKYFMFSTNNFVSIATASSISGPWTYVGQALPDGSSISGYSGVDIWAPDVKLVGSTYYMYYAVSSFGSQNSAIGVATSTTLEPGSWRDRGSTGVSSSSAKPYNAIDPNLMKVGSAYVMNFGSFWHDIYQVPLNTNLLTASGSAKNIAYNPAYSNGAQEGPYMYWKSPYYYLFTSWGNCCNLVPRPAAGTEYNIRVCRSTDASSGFVDKAGVDCLKSGGTIVLPSHDNVYAPGGQGILDDPVQGTVLYYHYVEANKGTSNAATILGWNKITWTNGWPTV